jgi:hypothetical protein
METLVLHNDCKVEAVDSGGLLSDAKHVVRRIKWRSKIELHNVRLVGQKLDGEQRSQGAAVLYGRR